jgi:hypothetical protein
MEAALVVLVDLEILPLVLLVRVAAAVLADIAGQEGAEGR